MYESADIILVGQAVAIDPNNLTVVMFFSTIFHSSSIGDFQVYFFLFQENLQFNLHEYAKNNMQFIGYSLVGLSNDEGI